MRRKSFQIPFSNSSHKHIRKCCVRNRKRHNVALSATSFIDLKVLGRLWAIFLDKNLMPKCFCQEICISFAIYRIEMTIDIFHWFFFRFFRWLTGAPSNSGSMLKLHFFLGRLFCKYAIANDFYFAFDLSLHKCPALFRRDQRRNGHSCISASVYSIAKLYLTAEFHAQGIGGL